MIIRVHPLVAALTSKDCRRLDPKLATDPIESTERFLATVQAKLASTPRLVKKSTPAKATWDFLSTRQTGATRAHNRGD